MRSSLQVYALVVGRRRRAIAAIRAARAAHFWCIENRTPNLTVDLTPHLRHICRAMWIPTLHPLLARMPSMRPQPSAPAAAARGQPAHKTPAAPTPADANEPPLTEEEQRERAGGFHESSFELRSGVDVLETEWPDDTTIPGTLDDL
jgi:hypothetical protein